VGKQSEGFDSYEGFLRLERERVLGNASQIGAAVRSLLAGNEPEKALAALAEEEWLPSDVIERLDRIAELCDLLATLLEPTLENLREEAKPTLLAASSAAQEITTTQEELTEAFAQASGSASAGASTPPTPATQSRAAWLRTWFQETLRPLVKRLSRSLWQIIVGMTNPQSWTLQGGVAIPWLADARISVTFGP